VSYLAIFSSVYRQDLPGARDVARQEIPVFAKATPESSALRVAHPLQHDCRLSCAIGATIMRSLAVLFANTAVMQPSTNAARQSAAPDSSLLQVFSKALQQASDNADSIISQPATLEKQGSPSSTITNSVEQSFDSNPVVPSQDAKPAAVEAPVQITKLDNKISVAASQAGASAEAGRSQAARTAAPHVQTKISATAPSTLQQSAVNADAAKPIDPDEGTEPTVLHANQKSPQNFSLLSLQPSGSAEQDQPIEKTVVSANSNLFPQQIVGARPGSAYQPLRSASASLKADNPGLGNVLQTVDAASNAPVNTDAATPIAPISVAPTQIDGIANKSADSKPSLNSAIESPSKAAANSAAPSNITNSAPSMDEAQTDSTQLDAASFSPSKPTPPPIDKSFVVPSTNDQSRAVTNDAPQTDVADPTVSDPLALPSIIPPTSPSTPDAQRTAPAEAPKVSAGSAPTANRLSAVAHPQNGAVAEMKDSGTAIPRSAVTGGTLPTDATERPHLSSNSEQASIKPDKEPTKPDTVNPQNPGPRSRDENQASTTPPMHLTSPVPAVAAPTDAGTQQMSVSPLDSQLSSIGPTPPSLGATHVSAATSPAPQDSKVSSQLDNIAASVRLAALGNSKGVTLLLSPQELGTVEINVSSRSQGTSSILLSVERPETLQLLQRDAPALQAALERAGLSTDQHHITIALAASGSATSGSSVPTGSNNPTTQSGPGANDLAGGGRSSQQSGNGQLASQPRTSTLISETKMVEPQAANLSLSRNSSAGLDITA
jgi:hypothetical protein